MNYAYTLRKGKEMKTFKEFIYETFTGTKESPADKEETLLRHKEYSKKAGKWKYEGAEEHPGGVYLHQYSRWKPNYANPDAKHEHVQGFYSKHKGLKPFNNRVDRPADE